MDLSAPFPLNYNHALVLQQFSVSGEITFPEAHQTFGVTVFPWVRSMYMYIAMLFLPDVGAQHYLNPNSDRIVYPLLWSKM